MFESTVALLRDAPLAVVPLLAISAAAARGLRRRRGVVYRLTKVAVSVGVVPLIGLFALAELTGQQVWQTLATGLFDIESWVVGHSLDLLDALVVAVLRAFLLLVDGVVGGLAGGAATTDGLPSWNPFAALTVAGFLASVFVVQFLVGVSTVWFVESSAGGASMNDWLTGVGGALFAAGVLWTLLGLEAFDASTLDLRLAVVAASGGVVAGVAAATRYRASSVRGALSLRGLPERGNSSDGTTSDSSASGDRPISADYAGSDDRSASSAGPDRSAGTATATGDAATAGTEGSRSKATPDADDSRSQSRFERVKETIRSKI